MDANLIINIVLTLAAISASVFAGLAWRQSKKIYKNEKDLRRAFMAPTENPGYISINDEIDDPDRLVISLENHGTNPALNVEASIKSFNSADVNGENPTVQPVFSMKVHAHNPIPKNSKWNVTIMEQEIPGLDELELLMSNYIVMKVKYSDKILDMEFTDTFYWEVGNDNNLNEVSGAEHERLKDIIDTTELQQ